MEEMRGESDTDEQLDVHHWKSYGELHEECVGVAKLRVGSPASG
jgi:hypothetical protein